MEVSHLKAQTTPVHRASNSVKRGAFPSVPTPTKQGWMRKYATLLQVTVMAIVAAATADGTIASAGALGSVAASLVLPFEVLVLQEAYETLAEAGGEEIERVLGYVSDALDPTKSDVGV